MKVIGKILIILLVLASCSTPIKTKSQRGIASFRPFISDCRQILIKWFSPKSEARSGIVQSQNMKELAQNVETFIDEETSTEEVVQVLDESSFYHEFDPQGVVTRQLEKKFYEGDAEEKIESEFNKGLFNLLAGISSKTENLYSFLELLQKMSNVPLEGNDQSKILFSSPFFRQLLSAADKQNISSSFQPNARFDNSKVLKNVEAVMKVLMNPDLVQASAYVESSYSFKKMIERIALGHLSTNREILTALSNSPFCQRMGIDLSMVSQIVSRVERTPQDLDEIIKDEIVVYQLGKKNLNSISPLDEEVNVVSVKDQCAWGSCWVHSAIAEEEIYISSKLGKKLELSANYFFVRQLIDRYAEAIQYDSNYDPKKEFQGGWRSRYLFMLDYYGLVPDYIWKPKKGFDSYVVKDELVAELDSLLKKYFEEKNKSTNLEGLKEKYQLMIKDKILEASGDLPVDFKYDGEWYNPQSFFKKFSSRSKSKAITYIKSDMIDRKDTAAFGGTFELVGGKWGYQMRQEASTIQKLTLGEIEKKIISEIKNGRPVIYNYFVPSEATYENGKFKEAYVNYQTGVMKAPLMGDIATKGSHSVLAVGFELNAFGRIKTLAVLNSAGEKRGVRGIFYIDESFFKRQTIDISFRE